jgi:hypothetical protein
MTYRSADLTAELHAVVDTDPPPCTLDLDDARVRGSAVRRRRRAAGAGSALAAVGLATVLAFALVPLAGSSSDQVTPADGGGRTVFAHDPLSTTVAFGWLPDGLHLSGGGIDSIVATDGTSEFDVSSLGPDSSPRCIAASSIPTSGGPGVAKTVTIKDPVPCGTRAPDVSGHTAHWITAPGTEEARAAGFVELQWEYAPHAWAYLRAYIGRDVSNDIVSTMYKVAESVRFGAAEPEPLPFRLPSAPAGMKLAGVSWQTQPRPHASAGDWTAPGADLSFSGTKADPSTHLVASMDFVIRPSSSTFPTAGEVNVGGEPAPASDVQHITVDGRQAVLIDDSRGQVHVEQLIVHDVDGADFRLTAVNQQAIADVDAAGGIVDYYRSMDVLGADRSDWTTDVIG